MRRRVVAAGAIFASLAYACGNGGGAGGAGGAHTSSQSAGGSAPCGSLMWDSPYAACNQCMVEQCCAELRACDTGTKCGDLLACEDACASGDAACATACQTAHADGQAAIDAAFTCYDASCQATAACGTPICDTGVSVQDPGCGACLTMSCCDSWKLCAQDMTCVACLTTIPPPAGCDDNALFMAAETCQSSSCAMPCAETICDTPLTAGAPACDYCLGQSCCAQVEACNQDASCLACLQSSGKGSGCGSEASYQAVETCWTGNCAMACAG